MADKLSFFEWWAREDDWDLDEAKKLMHQMLDQKYHDGDCTNQIHSCGLCCLQGVLDDYRDYFLDKEEK